MISFSVPIKKEHNNGETITHKSECKFIGLKNNRSNYRCKECNGTSTESVKDLIKNFPRMHQFCNRRY